MNNAIESPQDPLTLERLHREILELRERVEDLEDLRDLEDAIEENASKPLIPWENVRNEVGID